MNPRFLLLLLSIFLRTATSDRTNHITPRPAPYPDIADANDHQHLKPKNALQLHYHHPEHQASIHVSETSMPVVNLLHTSHVEGLVCNDTTATITFAAGAAHRFAVQHWQDMTPFALVHAFEACGNTPESHGWLIVEGLLQYGSTRPGEPGKALSMSVTQASYSEVVGPTTLAKLSFGTGSTTNIRDPPMASGSADTQYKRQPALQQNEPSKTLDGKARTSTTHKPYRRGFNPLAIVEGGLDKASSDTAGVIQTATEQAASVATDVPTKADSAAQQITAVADGATQQVPAPAANAAAAVVGAAKQEAPKAAEDAFDKADGVLQEAPAIAADVGGRLDDTAQQSRPSFLDGIRGRLSGAMEQVKDKVSTVHLDTSRVPKYAALFSQQFMDQPAMPLYSDNTFHVYCVDCRLVGDFRIDNGMEFAPATGVHTTALSIRSSRLSVVAQLGLEIVGPYERTIEVPVFFRAFSSELGLPYVGLAKLGGYGLYYEASISLTVKVSESTHLQLLAGAEFEWTEMFVSGNSTSDHTWEASGMTPQVKWAKAAQGQFDVNVTALLKNSIGVQAEMASKLPGFKEFPGGNIDVYVGPAFQVELEREDGGSKCGDDVSISRYTLVRAGFDADLHGGAFDHGAANHKDWNGAVKTVCPAGMQSSAGDNTATDIAQGEDGGAGADQPNTGTAPSKGSSNGRFWSRIFGSSKAKSSANTPEAGAFSGTSADSTT